MEERRKKSIVAKTWEMWQSSMGGRRSGSPETKLWPRRRKKGKRPPVGWFSVCVGERKEQFMVRTVYLNHPIFRSLLEEAEVEFGFAADGPLQLPCDVELFRRLVSDVEDDLEQGSVLATCPSPLASFSSPSGNYQLLGTSRSSPWRSLPASRR